jgi:succinylglutamic semialdehyde dehydrogenase
MSEMTLKGSLFNNEFHMPKLADERILKVCPGDLSQTLWSAQIDYTHIESVIESAQHGFEVWRKTSIKDRIIVLERYREIVTKKKEQLATAIALETGKPYWETLTEAGALAAKVTVTINDSLKRIETQTIKEILPKLDGHTIYKPLGPTLIIGPFNFPCHLANGQILSSLIAGNSIIFKPSEKTIYSSQLMSECLLEAGFPNGVINFINGTAHTSSTLAKDKRIKGVFFTGSHAVGMKILENTWDQLDKLVALELGGKNTTIIHEDADVDHTLAELLRACFLSSGQRCTSTSTVLIHEKVQDQFLEKFLALTKKIKVGHPIHSESFMGPLIDEHAVKAYEDYCKLCTSEGAQELIAFSKPDVGYTGHYVNPTVHYANVITSQTQFAKTEIFAPNVCFAPYSEIEDAIELCNISDYGLASSVFTKQSSIYDLCLRDITSGIINLNRSTVGASSRLPFGGLKNSGNHHPAAVSMIDHCAGVVASLETMDCSSSLDGVRGLEA